MTTTVIRRKLPARTKRLSSIAKSREDEEGASDEPPSDSEGIADIDARSDSGETETADNEDVFDDAAPVYTSPHEHHHHEHRSVDAMSDTALYLTIDCRDTINLNVTPAAIQLCKRFLHVYSQEQKELELKNSLGPEVILSILQKKEGEYEMVEEIKRKNTKERPGRSRSCDAPDDNDGFHMSSTSASALKKFAPSESMYEENPLLNSMKTPL
ncbi:vacuolar protein sorting-associated protein 13C [Caerostris extrusa]|uniref:Vacuolar protein sorting-associated protein 13C n=1 Tax=Caerostris extrusa TaxID=172846 RepID=A0AAV4X0B9_CAEEX|nr:vacuolar protein sorting-associated protein 13C [Caerostris extrusa]